jgi:hypothetical protein
MENLLNCSCENLNRRWKTFCWAPFGNMCLVCGMVQAMSARTYAVFKNCLMMVVATCEKCDVTILVKFV